MASRRLRYAVITGQQSINHGVHIEIFTNGRLMHEHRQPSVTSSREGLIPLVTEALTVMGDKGWRVVGTHHYFGPEAGDTDHLVIYLEGDAADDENPVDKQIDPIS